MGKISYKIFITLWLCIMFLSLANVLSSAQNAKYLVYLKDKNNTPFKLTEPEKFLSTRAIQRRLKQKISLQTRDLPPNPAYLQAIAATGAKIWYSSKWFNAVLVETDDSTLRQINQLPFILPKTIHLNKGKKENNQNQTSPIVPDTPKGENINIEVGNDKDYGSALLQNAMIGATKMHQQGYKGQNMVIAVFDSGFLNVNKLSCFKHLFHNKQVLGTYNFVENHPNVYGVGDHGTKVLSNIAAYKKGELIGTAPEANFYLFRTEDEFSEYRLEEVNWLIAAEYADSAGVDVINSSLGYTTFDDESSNYTYKDMNGKNAISSQAATLAARCGILVINSAGNEGDSYWQYVGAPADADSIISVGAVDKDEQRAFFSSKGNTFDKRLKPTLAAMGSGASVWSAFDFNTISSGTSFACPIFCGMATAFWQANPTLTNQEVISFLQQSASQAHKPDSLLGYGIPNFIKAQNLVKRKENPLKKGFFLYPNPLQKQELLKIYLSQTFINQNISITLYNSLGSIITKILLENAPQEYVLNNFNALQAGMYYLEIEAQHTKNTERLLIKE